jgi:hypothetical protein
MARMHGQRMRGIIGPPVLKENIVGAGGSISLGPRRPRGARRLYRRPRELGARACHLDFDLLKDVEPVAQLPDNPSLIVARKAGPGEQGVDRLAESQPGQGIRWDPRRWRRTSRACFSRAPASNSYPIVVRIRPREPLRINSGAPPALHPNRNSRIASWPPCITSIRSWSFTSGPTSLIRLSDMIRISETLI